MRNLRAMAADLLAHPVCPVPPVEHVAARARAIRARRRSLAAAGLLAALAVTWHAIGHQPPGKEFGMATVKSWAL